MSYNPGIPSRRTTMAGKPNPKVQEALALVAQGHTVYAACKATGAVQASVYAAVKRGAVKKEPKPVLLYAELERHIRAGGEMREGARATLAYLNRLLAVVDAEDAEVSFARPTIPVAPDFIE